MVGCTRVTGGGTYPVPTQTISKDFSPPHFAYACTPPRLGRATGKSGWDDSCAGHLAEAIEAGLRTSCVRTVSLSAEVLYITVLPWQYASSVAGSLRLC